jgi:hypothetical protein
MQTISPAEQGKPQEGPPIRRKSLLPVDPSTLAALTVHKSLEGILPMLLEKEKEV